MLRESSNGCLLLAKTLASELNTLSNERASKLYGCRPRSPNFNAYAERFVRLVKEECVSKFIPIGSGILRRSLREYLEHYHRERNHQGLGNRLIVPLRIPGRANERIQWRSRLGGVPRYYERAAA